MWWVGETTLLHSRTKQLRLSCYVNQTGTQTIPDSRKSLQTCKDIIVEILVDTRGRTYSSSISSLSLSLASLRQTSAKMDGYLSHNML